MSVIMKEVHQQVKHINYHVVHAIPGRLRLRIPKLAEDSEYAKKLQHLVEGLDFVTHARINSPASSLVVEYDAKKYGSLAATLQEQIFRIIDSPEKLPTDAQEVPAEESGVVTDNTAENLPTDAEKKELSKEELAAIENPGVGPRHHLRRR